MRKIYKKKLLFLIALVLLFSSTYGQLTGVKNIPGDYSTVALAITDLNTAGVGAGGVTFNIAAGYTETFTSPTAGLITATGTSADPIIFQKSGAGLNPVITAGIGVSTSVDGIIVLRGSDYVTFDGIDLTESAGNTDATTQMEWGYALVKVDGTNGSQNNVIKNCTVTLNKANTYSVCIYAGNHTDIVTTALTVTSLAGANSGNKFFGNTLSNCYKGISIGGYADAVSPYSYYDQNNEIGVTAGNTISNFAGSTFATQAIYTIYQNNIKIANNNITGGSASTGTLYAIYAAEGLNANGEIYGNYISLSPTGTTSNVHCIAVNIGGTGTNNTVSIHDNTIENINWSSATTGVFYGIRIYVSAGANPKDMNIYNNIIRNNTINGTGNLNLIHSGASAGTNNISIYSNQIYGNQKSGASGTMNCVLATTATVSFHDNMIYNNTIPTTTGTSAAVLYGYYNYGSPLSENIYNNTIYGLSIGGTTTATASIVRGIYTNTTASALKNIYSNQIYNLSISSTGGGTVEGIYQTLGTPTSVYKNNIYNLSTTGASGLANGITIAGGATNHIYNNYVSDIKAPAATGANAVIGINISGGTTANVFYNTVYLNATSTGATFGSSGIYKSSTTTGDFRNNIVVNVSTPGTTSGNTVAYRWSGAYNATYYSVNSNNNCFFAGTPAANYLIFYDGTNSDQTITAYKARVTGRDGSSFTENVPFINVATTPYNLHLSTSIATQCESNGVRVTAPLAVTTDFDNDLRYGETGYPGTGAATDVGADEGNFIMLDLTPPSISYTPLMNTSSTGARTLAVTITDASGVGSGANQPVLYWQINALGYSTPVAPTSVVGNVYTYTLGAGVATGDVVSYFVVAQDNATTPNVVSYPAGATVTATPPLMVTPPPTPSTYTIIGTICGTKTVGTGGDYPTLTAAIAAFNSSEMTCPVVFELLNADYSTAETFPLTINANSGSSATNTLTIKPAAGVNAVITNAAATSIIKLNGADYVIIDGSNNGTNSRNLSIINTNTALSTIIWIGSASSTDGATYNTVKNCNLNGSSGTTTTACILAGSGTTLGNAAESPNSYTTITNNSFSATQNGVFYSGNAIVLDANILVTNNVFGSTVAANKHGYRGIILQNVQNFTISGNTIAGVSTTGTSTTTGIQIGGLANGGTISRNIISDIKNTNSGGYGCNGIILASSSTTAGITVANNIIYDVAAYGYAGGGSADNGYGIIISAGGGYNIYYNTVVMNTDQTATTGYPAAFNVTSGVTTANSLDVRNNIFYNAQTIGTQRYSVYCGAANTVFSNLNYNDYYTSGANLGYIGASNRLDLAAWKIGTGKDLNSLSVVPSFASTSDLHLTGCELNAGYPIGSVTTDIDGIVRSLDIPTIGAYEHIGSALTASFNPLDGATGVGVGSSVIITFSENARKTDGSAIDASVVTFENLTDVTTVPFNINYTGTVLTVTPTSVLLGLTDYRVTISGVESECNIALSGDNSTTFTTGSTDFTAPLYVSSSVENAAPSNVVVVFDENIAATGYEGFTINVEGSPVSITGYSVLTTNLTLTLTAPVTTHQAVTIEYNATLGNVTDVSGNPLATFGPSDVTNNTMSNEKNILTFAFLAADNSGAGITADVSGVVGTNTISFTLSNTIDFTGLIPTITISEYASVDPLSGVANDFTNPATYTVEAEDGTTKVYTVTINKVYELPLVENFDGSTKPADWSEVNSAGVTTPRWNANNTSNAGGSPYEMRCSYQNINPGTTRFVTPMLNTEGVSNLVLSFRHMLDTYGTGATLRIQSSSDGVNWTDEEWFAESSSTNISAEQVTTSIVNNLGTTTQIAFVVTGNLYNIDYWYVDNVNIYVPLNLDASVSTVTEEWALEGNALTPFATVQNAGLNTVSFDVELSITDGGSYTYNQTVNVADLPGGESIDLTFTDVILPTAGDYTATVTTLLAGDQNSANDIRTTTYTMLNTDNIAYGYSIYSEGGAVAKGPVVYDLSAPDKIFNIADHTTDLYSARGGEFVNGVWYAYDTYSTTDRRFITIDRTTGEKSIIAAGLSYAPIDLAYDWTAGVLYGIVQFTGSTYALYTVDLSTGAITQVGTTLSGTPITLACNLEGQLYSVYTDGSLYSINKTDAVATLIGATGITGINYVQSMAFDHRNGDVLYWNQQGSTPTGNLYTIDVATGTATLVAPLEGLSEIVGFAIPYQPEVYYTVNFSVVGSNGTLDAAIEGGNAIVTGDEVLAGSNVIFTASPDANYQVKEWTLNGDIVPDNTTNTLTVENLQEIITVTVEFEEIPVTAPITFVVDNTANTDFTGFALKGSWDEFGNYDAAWNGGAEQADFYDDGTNGDETADDDIWTVIVNLVPDGGTNTWEWGVNDQDGNWIDGNFQFTVADETPQTLTYTTVGISDLLNTIQVYPNPSNGIFKVYVDEPVNFRITDVNGKILNESKITGHDQIQIPTSGIYFMHVWRNNESGTIKLIVK